MFSVLIFTTVLSFMSMFIWEALGPMVFGALLLIAVILTGVLKIGISIGSKRKEATLKLAQKDTNTQQGEPEEGRYRHGIFRFGVARVDSDIPTEELVTILHQMHHIMARHGTRTLLGRLANDLECTQPKDARNLRTTAIGLVNNMPCVENKEAFFQRAHAYLANIPQAVREDFGWSDKMFHAAVVHQHDDRTTASDEPVPAASGRLTLRPVVDPAPLAPPQISKRAPTNANGVLALAKELARHPDMAFAALAQALVPPLQILDEALRTRADNDPLCTPLTDSILPRAGAALTLYARLHGMPLLSAGEQEVLDGTRDTLARLPALLEAHVQNLRRGEFQQLAGMAHAIEAIDFSLDTPRGLLLAHLNPNAAREAAAEKVA